MKDWERYARWIADRVAGPDSRWRAPIVATPRHLLIPHWWVPDGNEWELRVGPADEQAWSRAAYSDRTLVTRVGPLHADLAYEDDRPTGKATSSSTLPGLVVQMLRHARIQDNCCVLDVGTGSGYSSALLAHRLGDNLVTSVDIDPYLVKVAAERLATIGLHPRLEPVDATGPLPGTYDRIVSMVSVKPIPASWLAALRPGGRLVTVIAGTMAIITATKGKDGTAKGRVEWDRAGFMATRSGSDYPPQSQNFAAIKHQDGEEVTHGRYPVVEVKEAWELCSMLEIIAPDIMHYYEESDDGTRTAWMVHADGSWARATAHGTEAPIVHQAGPRRLWNILDELRDDWLSHGYFQLYGAEVTIPPEGSKIHLARGTWKATIT